MTRWSLEGEGEAPAYFVKVAVDDGGRVYVADDLTKKIVVFAPTTGSPDGGSPSEKT